ncbi:MAG: nucleotide exchange factor GrpE [bacterium]|nr:nucleotide exchange factor GrpE [bacterium]
MKDKVSELRKILNQQKQSNQTENFDPDQTISENVSEIKEVDGDVGHPISDTSDKSDVSEEKGFKEQLAQLQDKYNKAMEANKAQSNMYLAKAAEFENFKKRLQKEHDDFSQYANEKLITELLPIIDSLEQTLDHAPQKDDPFVAGVALIHKQVIQTLTKFGVEVILGEGETFDPHRQEAIGTEKNKEFDADKVIMVHRTGYILNGKVIRAALVTVSQ